MQGFFGLWRSGGPLCFPFNGPFRPQKGYLLWRSCSRRCLLSTNKVFFVDGQSLIAFCLHRRYFFCGGTASFWHLSSTPGTLFVDRRLQMNTSVHARGVLCGGNASHGTFCPQNKCILWKKRHFLTQFFVILPHNHNTTTT